jgi:hypothetical protein
MLASPTLMEMLARNRGDELRRHAQKATVRRRSSDPRRAIASARSGTGWLLVDLGLRLTVPRNTMRRPVARGR